MYVSDRFCDPHCKYCGYLGEEDISEVDST